MKPITVIIPVYNAFDVTLDCIRSVLATIPRGIKVVVIDDASPSGDLREFLPREVVRHPQLVVLRNETNLGFVGSCNRGMILESEGDVILLNSDTVVTPRWIQKLKEAAYSRLNIGTVTPLTNNGTICSVPCFLENNSIPDGYTLERFSSLVEQLSERSYVEAPTCVGFCTYIRRDMLDAVGFFDPIFQQGYGEENDLSLRGRAKGFLNIIDDATYVYHRGNMSFKEMRESLSETNSAILRDRYPDYERSVAQFCAGNPLARVQARIWNALVAQFVSTKQRTVLHVLHNGPFISRRHGLGGTELHVQSIIRNDKESAHFSISPGASCFYLTAHLKGADRTLEIPAGVLPALFSPLFFSVIHLHHSLGFDFEMLTNALKCHGQYLVSVHDYHLVCGRLWLVKNDFSVCDGISCEGSCFESPTVASQRRALARRLFEGAKKILVFSQSSKSIISGLFGDLPSLEVSSHGIEVVERRPVPIPPRPAGELPLKILCLGTLVAHKGSGFIKAASSELSRIGDVRLEWHFLGRAHEEVEVLIDHGSYTPLNLRSKMAEIGAHVVLLAPQCQETYSITLDEAVWSGLPVICSPFGALPERVTGWGIGYVFDNTVPGLHAILHEILTDWPGYVTRCERTHVAPIRPVSSEVAGCSAVYRELSHGSVIQGDALVRFVQPDMVGSPRSRRIRFEEWLVGLLRRIEIYDFEVGRC